jgi:hypothetical protein
MSIEFGEMFMNLASTPSTVADATLSVCDLASLTLQATSDRSWLIPPLKSLNFNAGGVRSVTLVGHGC